jgi:hypothetical protein
MGGGCYGNRNESGNKLTGRIKPRRRSAVAPKVAGAESKNPVELPATCDCPRKCHAACVEAPANDVKEMFSMLLRLVWRAPRCRRLCGVSAGQRRDQLQSFPSRGQTRGAHSADALHPLRAQRHPRTKNHARVFRDLTMTVWKSCSFLKRSVKLCAICGWPSETSTRVIDAPKITGAFLGTSQ